MIQFRSKVLDWMSPELRLRALDRLDHFEQFFDDLGSPFRNMAAKLKDVGK